jgi:hypothetical protein
MVLGTVFLNLEKHEFSDKLVLDFKKQCIASGPAELKAKDGQRKMKEIYDSLSKLIEKKG